MTELRTRLARGERFDAIPRIVHQTWKTSEIPPDWKAWHESWPHHHPDWQHVLWTDEDNRRLIAERHAWFLPCYDAFPRDIQRVDAAKYFILYTFGGVYADLDTECRQPVDRATALGGALLSRSRDGVIDCSFLASSPRHPLWEQSFREMQSPPWIARALRGVPGIDASHVLFSTGPHMMRRAVRRYLSLVADQHDGDGITICAPEYFSSRSWWNRREPFREPEALVHHHYGDSWLQPLEAAVVRHCTLRKLTIGAALLAGAALLGFVGGEVIP